MQLVLVAAVVRGPFGAELLGQCFVAGLERSSVLSHVFVGVEWLDIHAVPFVSEQNTVKGS